jgi:His-Xaa-Ser system protein HxsD
MPDETVEGAERSSDLTFDLDSNRVTFAIDEEIYPRDAIYGAAYLFLNRCYVFLGRPADKTVSVQLRSKTPADEGALVALAGEYANELLNQVVRIRVGEATARIREYTLAKAFFSDPGRSTIDALLAELDAEELDEDPLEIEVPWEKPADG